MGDQRMRGKVTTYGRATPPLPGAGLNRLNREIKIKAMSAADRKRKQPHKLEPKRRGRGLSPGNGSTKVGRRRGPVVTVGLRTLARPFSLPRTAPLNFNRSHNPQPPSNRAALRSFSSSYEIGLSFMSNQAIPTSGNGEPLRPLT